MRNLKVCAVMAAALVLGSATSLFAQRPNRPADSYGKKGGRPDNAPQRPAGSWENKGGRPENAPQRPPESRGKQGGRPENVPGRPR